MEGLDVDWKMEEEEGKNDMKWILEKGCNIAKKVVVTGFVISSAPLIIPPIVIVSTLGFALSVPLGVIFASYACTKKIMNMLLPMPTSSPLMEHDTLLEYHDEDEEYEAKRSGNEDQSREDKGTEERRDVKIEGEGDEEELGTIKEGKKDNEPLPKSSGGRIEPEGVETEKGPVDQERKEDKTSPESGGGKIEEERRESEKGPIEEEKKNGEPSSELSGEEKQQSEPEKVAEDSVEKNKDEGNGGDAAKKKKKKTKSGAKN